MLEAAVVFLPLLGAIIAGFGNKKLGDKGAQIVTCTGLILAAICAWILFFDVAIGGNARTVTLFTWVESGSFTFDWALRMDTLSAVMLIVVTTVSSVVHLYSIGYMHHDHSVPRFMAYLSLFTFFMLMLVTADNLVQLFFGWEGVGLASYLLIGFWYERPSACSAAMKAFIVNRVGDVAFALGIFGVFVLVGSVEFDAIFAAMADKNTAVLHFLGWDFHALTILSILLFIGACGKSAQLGLHTWLPDAMEGPTPVSALIHAATMVTAGVFLVCRMSPMIEYSDVALGIITVVGASTAFFAATIGLTQTDIKRVIAYSTCSQLGYMFFAAGISAYPAAMFHLMTHAFFKALLFLGAGSVIHAMSDEQDMRRMGGLYKLIPITYAFMWIGSLALMGIGIPGTPIGFAGFFSKDVVLEAAYAAHTAVGGYAFWMGVVAAFMTAFYSARLLFLTFHGTPRCDEHTLAHVHESPKVMWVPLLILVAGSLFAGVLGYNLFVGEGMESFWGEAIYIAPQHQALEHAHHVPLWVKLAPLVVGLAGIALAWFVYLKAPGTDRKIANAIPALYRFSLNKWYFDELYDRVFVQPARWLGKGLWKADGEVIDGVGPDGVAGMSARIARVTSALQSGYVYHYAFAMMIGVVCLISWYLLFA